jgi:FkbM family methyltransferase
LDHKQEPTVNTLFDTPKCRDLIYDIGLHKGEDAEFYLLKGFRVVAFEADPELVAFCRARLKKFVDSGQLTIVEGAIVDPDMLKAGKNTVMFYTNRENSVWGTVLSDWAKRNNHLLDSRFKNTRQENPGSAIEVNAIRFADALRMNGMPYYMKIDIEGCDMICLTALSAFKERPSYVSIESDKLSFKNTEHEIELFARLGYRSFQAVNQATVHRQKPPQPTKEGQYTEHRFERGSSGLFGRDLKDEWCSREAILRKYRLIHLGYFLFGDEGKVFLKSKTKPARLLTALTRHALAFLSRQSVPGWYDTHARHTTAEAGSEGAVDSR